MFVVIGCSGLFVSGGDMDGRRVLWKWVIGIVESSWGGHRDGPVGDVRWVNEESMLADIAEAVV